MEKNTFRAPVEQTNSASNNIKKSNIENSTTHNNGIDTIIINTKKKENQPEEKENNIIYKKKGYGLINQKSQEVVFTPPIEEYKSSTLKVGRHNSKLEIIKEEKEHERTSVSPKERIKTLEKPESKPTINELLGNESNPNIDTVKGNQSKPIIKNKKEIIVESLNFDGIESEDNYTDYEALKPIKVNKSGKKVEPNGLNSSLLHLDKEKQEPVSKSFFQINDETHSSNNKTNEKLNRSYHSKKINEFWINRKH